MRSSRRRLQLFCTLPRFFRTLRRQGRRPFPQGFAPLRPHGLQGEAKCGIDKGMVGRSGDPLSRTGTTAKVIREACLKGRILFRFYFACPHTSPRRSLKVQTDPIPSRRGTRGPTFRLIPSKRFFLLKTPSRYSALPSASPSVK